jgi:hypothetical protein
MHAMTCSPYARRDFTTTRLPAEPRRGSSGSGSGESQFGRAFPGVVQDRRPSSLGTMGSSRRLTSIKKSTSLWAFLLPALRSRTPGHFPPQGELPDAGFHPDVL